MARRLNEHNKKTHKLITEKVEFKKQRAFNRKNSYMPQLEEFGDIDDADAFRKNVGKMRRSFDAGKKREIANTVVKDVTFHRLEKDIMAASVTDSMLGTGFGSKQGARRTSSMFKRRTGSSLGPTHAPNGPSPKLAASPGLNGAASPELREGPV